ncbi:MAG: hypothetical protein AB7E81_01440 [Hyphomicrobiaceae bacterium]
MSMHSFGHMTDLEHPTVWQMMAAFASDEYELREIAPGEFEIIATMPNKEAEASNMTSDEVQSAAAVAEPTRVLQP